MNPPPTVLVTGSTDGIGWATARALAHHGALVVLHGRSEERLERAWRALCEVAGDRLPSPVRADFSRLDDVRAMATELAARGQRIDVLVSNAGVFMNRRVETADGFELTMAVNHLAPFLLAHLLLAGEIGSWLKNVLFVASDAHVHGRVDPTDPGGARAAFDRLGSYCASKLANVITSVELAWRLTGRGVRVNALHPGVISTKLLTEGFGGRGPDSVEDAAAVVSRLALSTEPPAATGRYFDRLQPARPAPASEDRALAARFYLASAAAVGVAPLPWADSRAAHVGHGSLRSPLAYANGLLV